MAIDLEIPSKNDNFNYQLLYRLKTDCEYFLNWGMRNPKRLWALNVNDHIDTMIKLFKALPFTPDWISFADIEQYKKEMEMQEV